MTALPDPLPHLLTVEECAALGETESGYTELQEGRLLMSPSPVPDHNRALFKLIACHLAGEFGYQDTGAVSGEFRAEEPFEVRLRLDQLR